MSIHMSIHRIEAARPTVGPSPVEGAVSCAVSTSTQGCHLKARTLHACNLTCLRAHTHACTHACPHTHMPAYTHARMHAYPHTRMSACTHARMHAYLHTRMNAYTHARIHAYLHTRMPACTAVGHGVGHWLSGPVHHRRCRRRGSHPVSGSAHDRRCWRSCDSSLPSRALRTRCTRTGRHCRCQSPGGRQRRLIAPPPNTRHAPISPHGCGVLRGRK